MSMRLACLYFVCACNAVDLSLGSPAPSAHVAVIGILHDGRIIQHSQPEPEAEESFSVELPDTVAVLILSCTAPFPVEWVFTDRSPGLSDNMLRLHINSSRATPSGSPYLEQKDEYTFQTHLTFTFRPPAEPRQQLCRDATTGGREKLVTSVASEMHGRFMRLLVSRNQTPPDKDNEPRFGNDLNCSHIIEFYESPVGDHGAHVCCSTLDPEADYRLFTRGCSNLPNCRGLFRQTNCTRKMKGMPNRDIDECISTSELAHHGASGVIVCGHPSVDSNSVSVQYYTSVMPLCDDGKVGRDVHFYIRQETDPSTVGGEMLELCPLPHSMLYVGERSEITCAGSYYNFAGGFLLILRRNGSWQSTPFEERLSGVETQIFTSYAPERDFIREVRIYKASVTLNDTDMYEVQCAAPVWNSHEWVNKSRQITVRHPTPVTFAGTAAEEVTISGEFNITCSASGDPPPSLSWSNLTDTFMRPLPSTPTDVEIVMTLEFEYWPSLSEFEVVTVYCRADQDRVNRTDWKTYRLRRYPGPKFPVVMVLSIAGGVVILGIAVACLIWWRRMMQTKDKWRSLSQDEIDEFFHGRGCTATGEGQEHSVPARTIDEAEESAWGRKYDFSFEVTLGHDLILGPKIAKGEFGQIYSGQLKDLPVAVKKNLAFASMLDFRASLHELKLLIHIGQYPNIVRLVGAVTSNVKRRELYLVLEHCSHGDMKTYMRRNHEQLLARGRRQSVRGASICAASCRTYLSIEHLKLVQVAKMCLMPWALEILDALVFLRNTRVVHGDIAARNVVLDAELHAKICDFGMSHEVTAAEGYVYGISPHVRQPCNSSAPESLDPDRREYSFYSDVYSFAVLLWEMFSLGGDPWAGERPERILSILQAGECLPVPHVQTVGSCVETCLVPMVIYEKMKECWTLEPRLRPTVQALQEYFAQSQSKI